MPDGPPTRDDVLRAAGTIEGRVRRTPLLEAERLAPGLRLKAELLQHTGSFKARGVTNRLAALGADERRRGVVGASAGNHAIALAFGAEREGVSCLVCTWASASPYKLARAREHGAEIDATAPDPTHVFERLEEVVQETGRVLVHPFDDPLVMAGQGTVGLEVLEDAPDTDVIVVPTGGGGLVGGIATAVAPLGVRVVAVEPSGSAAVRLALEAGAPVPVAPTTIAGGLDAPFAGANVVAACLATRVESVVVTDAEIEEATRRVYGDAKLACEPAGAAGIAAVLAGKVEGERITVVVSGGNVAPETASAILAPR